MFSVTLEGTLQMETLTVKTEYIFLRRGVCFCHLGGSEESPPFQKSENNVRIFRIFRFQRMHRKLTVLNIYSFYYFIYFIINYFKKKVKQNHPVSLLQKCGCQVKMTL